jgi:hypothetical protein
MDMDPLYWVVVVQRRQEFTGNGNKATEDVVLKMPFKHVQGA